MCLFDVSRGRQHVCALSARRWRIAGENSLLIEGGQGAPSFSTILRRRPSQVSEQSAAHLLDGCWQDTPRVSQLPQRSENGSRARPSGVTGNCGEISLARSISTTASWCRPIAERL